VQRGEHRARHEHTELQRRKLNLKAKLESSLQCFSFNRLVPDAFNVGLIGSTCTAIPSAAARAAARVERRKLNLKAKIESGLSYFTFKSLIPGAFNVGLIGSTCTDLPGCAH
jgi:hypothetical protein